MEHPTLGELVRRAGLRFRKLADRHLSRLGFSAGQLPVLTALMCDGTLSQKAIVERAAVEQPTVAATMARMVRDGWLVRAKHPANSRGVNYQLSEAALKRVPNVLAEIAHMSELASSSLTEVERTQLAFLLRKAITAFEDELK